MIQMKRFGLGTFANDEDSKNNNQDYGKDSKHEEKKLFPERNGIGWDILRGLITLLFYVCQLIVAIVFISFIISAIAFCITVALDIVSEMIAPAAATKSKKDLLSVCLFVILLALFIVASFMLSLFAEVFKAVVLKTSLQYNIARVLFVLVALVVGGLWVGIERTESNRVSFAEYLEFVVVVCWIFAFVFSLLGSVLFLIFVFTRSVNNRKVLFACVAIVLLLAAFAVISPIAFGIVAEEASAGTISFVIFFPLLSSLLVMYTYFRGKTKDRKTFIINKYVCLLGLALFIFTIILSLFVNAPATCKSSCRDEARANAIKVDREAFFSNRYPVCLQTWTSIKLNIADLAFFANLTYNKAVKDGNSAAVLTMANGFFQPQNFNWSLDNDMKSSSRFLHFRHQNVHVFGIKGPVTNAEFAETARLWDEVAALQSVGLIVPILTYFPVRFVAEYVSKTSFINTVFHSGSNTRLFDDIESRLKGINKTSDDVVLVGHSFGGGIAKIIGARLQIPAVAFSSPGILYGNVKFGFSLENASKFSVSISPQKDPVPLIDKHVGLQQTINCDGKTSVQCHLIERTYCELHIGCGQGRSGCQAIMDN
ncbi:uncharacterized protein LOC110245285 [Exaiptasia diaphana]|uniref:Fungal lipase-type domain-containing protein n=1 Tax=Exaiptasia diaphana TaxID=2652724 RepID=A0A913XMG3_EXADI|nr:uncharacterized protein LOC110245285 [Exaiptasia diaphana]KXJ25447.1 hypothetical protein AC249_AIPGENE6928 [Exaiptasia diaphana]